MRTTLAALFAAMAVMLTTAAPAQIKDNLRFSITELRRAEALANAAGAYFQRAGNDGSTGPMAEQRAGSFAKFRGAIDIFVETAPKPIAAAALDGIQLFFSNPAPIPQTLFEVVEECERGNDPQLTRRVVGRLTTALSAARADLEAEERFGPLSDNPVFYGAIRPPTDGNSLLRNLAFALDHDVVLRRDFYAPENLHRFFGAYPTVYRTPGGGIWGRWFVKPTSEEKSVLEPDAKRYAQCQYSAGLDVVTDGRKHGGISIACNFKSGISPSVDEVERSFGRDWQNTWQPPTHSPPDPRTVPNGNIRMTYDFDKGGLHRSVEASFGPNGTFSSFSFEIEER